MSVIRAKQTPQLWCYYRPWMGTVLGFSSTIAETKCLNSAGAPSLAVPAFSFDRQGGRVGDVDSFIHSGYFYRASLSPLLLRSAPDTARILCQSFTKRQLRVKHLPKVLTWPLERDSNWRSFGRKAPNLPMSHHAQLCRCSFFGSVSPKLEWRRRRATLMMYVITELTNWIQIIGVCRMKKPTCTCIL